MVVLKIISSRELSLFFFCVWLPTNACIEAEGIQIISLFFFFPMYHAMLQVPEPMMPIKHFLVKKTAAKDCHHH